MVVLSLQPYRGNHQRFYPHIGYLNLTPVIIQGILRVSLEEDLKPLKTSSILVRLRCYEVEAAGGRTVRVLREFSEVLWTAGGNEGWEEVGEFERAWRIVVPAERGLCGTTTFKTFRTWWQVEAVMNHKPIPMQGSRKLTSHQIPLINYSPPPSLPLPLPLWTSPPSTQRRLAYRITPSKSSYAPNELMEISVEFSREDPGLCVRRIVVGLERRVVLSSDGGEERSGSGSEGDEITLSDGEIYRTPHQEDTPLLPPTTTKRTFLRSASPFRSRASGSAESESRPLTPLPSSSSSSIKSAPTSILVMEKEDVIFDHEGMGRLVLGGVVPRSKSVYRYSVGDTFSTKFARVEFLLIVRIHIKTKIGGNEIIELDPQTIHIEGTTSSEREVALGLGDKLLGIAEAELRISLPPPSTTTPIISMPMDSTPPMTMTMVDTERKEGTKQERRKLRSETRPLEGRRRRSEELDAPRKARPRTREHPPPSSSSTDDSAAPNPKTNLNLNHNGGLLRPETIRRPHTADSRPTTTMASSLSISTTATSEGINSRRSSRRGLRSTGVSAGGNGPPYSAGNRPRSAGSALSYRSLDVGVQIEDQGSSIGISRLVPTLDTRNTSVVMVVDQGVDGDISRSSPESESAEIIQYETVGFEGFSITPEGSRGSGGGGVGVVEMKGEEEFETVVEVLSVDSGTSTTSTSSTISPPPSTIFPNSTTTTTTTTLDRSQKRKSGIISLFVRESSVESTTTTSSVGYVKEHGRWGFLRRGSKS